MQQHLFLPVCMLELICWRYDVTNSLVPLVRKTLCAVAFSAALLAGPVFAETGDGTQSPAPAFLDELAPDAVAVTDPEEIRRKLSELTIFGRYYDGESWIEYHLGDGRTAYYEKGCTYPGKWWVERGEVCYAYPNYRDGAPNCFVMFVRPGGGIQFVAFGADEAPYLASSSTELASGNAAHLPITSLSPCLSS
jgi:hypothetical protein